MPNMAKAFVQTPRDCRNSLKDVFEDLQLLHCELCYRVQLSNN